MSWEQDAAEAREVEWEIARDWELWHPGSRAVLNEPGYDERKDFVLVLGSGRPERIEVKWDKLSSSTGNLCFEAESLNRTRSALWLHYSARFGLYAYHPLLLREWLARPELRPCHKAVMGDGNVSGHAVPAPWVNAQTWVNRYPGYRLARDLPI